MSKDLFSKQSDLYARYRPGYPPDLFQYILKFVAGRSSAWDCATGNGQAALLLVPHFDVVFATDMSNKQIALAVKHPRIEYSVSTAEKTLFPNSCFDLITVAQAYHWFNFSAFETEVRRVLKPDGIIAVWGYSLVTTSALAVNAVINTFYRETTSPFWDPERKHIDDHYRTVSFPYDELPAAEFYIEQQWSVEDLSGYLNTWSSVQHFIKAKGFNPVDTLVLDLKKAWPSEEIIPFRFPLFLRLGKTKHQA